MARMYPGDDETVPQIETPEDIGEAWRRIAENARTERSDEDSFDYERVDKALLDAHKKAVQWGAGVDQERVDFEKSPGIWTNSDQVPEYVREAVKRLIEEEDIVYSSYEKLPQGAQQDIADILEEQMTQPQGWSLESLIDALTDRFDVSTTYAANVMRNESAAILNTAREEAYEEREDSDEYVYDWIGPLDHRTTDTCRAIENEIDSRGGAVPMDTLKDILREKAREHSDAEGTPGRVDDWQPHYQCRRTFVRRVQTI